MLFLRYKNELTLTLKKSPQRLDFCGASLMPNKNSFTLNYLHFFTAFFVSRVASIKLNAKPPLRASFTDILVLLVDTASLSDKVGFLL